MASNEYPNVLEMEKSLLGAMLQYGDAIIPTVTATLTADDFYRPQHRLIFKAVATLYAQGKKPDVLLVEEELIKHNVLENVERIYLWSLLEKSHSATRAATYVDIVKEKSLRRKLITVGQEVSEGAKDESKDIREVLDTYEQKIWAVASQTHQNIFESTKDTCWKSFERILNIRKHQGELSGVPTKLHDLDKRTNGWQNSDLILLAARPSMGKTALALNMAVGAAKAQKTVAIFSLEMSKMQLGNRLLSLESGVNSQQLNTGELDKDDINALADALERLAELKLYIDDTAGISLLELRSKARQLKLERGLDLIVIDYLQLMQGGRQENRQQEISEISRGLKALARELNVPVLALSQLSRSVEMRAEKKPQLSDLRESGSLEQDADIVMFLYRDEYYNRDDADSQNLAELIIAKNRNGPTDSVMLQFNKEIMRFGDLTRRES